MVKQKLAVIFGGCSTEYPVSLESASAVIDHIDRTAVDPVLLGITRDGRWLRYYGDADGIRADTWHSGPQAVTAFLSPCRSTHGILEVSDGRMHAIPIDAALPVLHGKNGEDGTVQGLLELAGIPVIGCDLRSSVLCMDKDIAHTIVRAAGIRVPRYAVLREEADLTAQSEEIAGLGYPLFVKPARAGSSIGITRVTSLPLLKQAVLKALEYDNKVVVEEAVDGFEVGCAILGTHDPIVGEVDEIELARGFFDYREKYNLITSQIHMPARISSELAEQIKATALRVYQALECRGFARVDLFLGREGAIYFNEVNTIPGFTAHSRFPNMLQGAGMSFEEIIGCLLREKVPVC